MRGGAKKSSKKKTVSHKRASSSRSKKKTAKRSARKKMVSASKEQCFWVHDGPVLSNLRELRDAIHKMPEEVYLYHAKGKQNDFANWVEFVLGDATCARNLRKAKSQRSAHTSLKNRVAFYSGK